MNDFNESEIPQISVEEVKKAIEKKEKCILLDVRTENEYRRGKIAGSINLPVDKVEDEALKVIPDKSIKIYIYCLSGSRSIYAAKTMIKIGYTNVFNVEFGLLSWRANNFPVTM